MTRTKTNIKITRTLRALALVVCMTFGTAVSAQAGFEPNTDYSAAMVQAALNADHEAGRAAEQDRNEKIESLGLDVDIFSYDEMLLLAQLIQTEAGSAWLPQEWRMAVGEVVLNRIDSPEFPNSMEEVIFQPGQYSAACEDWFSVLVPYDYCLTAAVSILSGERILGDSSVVFQSGVVHGGGVHTEFYDHMYGSTYFSYSANRHLYS